MKKVFVVYKKIDKEIVAFGNIEIGKRKLHDLKNVILLEDVDIDSILISSMVSSVEKICKYLFICCKNVNYKTKPLHIILPKPNTYCEKLWWWS